MNTINLRPLRRFTTPLLFLFAALAFPAAAAERTVAPLPPVETFTDADRPKGYNDGISTWEEPWGYRRPENASRLYPLVVFGPWNESGYFTPALRKTYPAFYLVIDDASEAAGAALSDRIDAAMASQGFRIALNRIHLTGFSMGGSGSYKTIRGFLSRGKCFAGLIRLAGQSESVLAEGAINKLAISMHIGLKDSQQRIDVSRALYAQIRNHPANAQAIETVLDEPAFGRITKVLTLEGVDVIRYSEYAGMGHSTDVPYSDPALYSWIMTRAIGSPIPNVPPSIPTNVRGGAASPTSIALTWTASSDDVGVTGYRIYRDGAPLAATVTTTAYADTGLTTGATHTYTIVAFDAAGAASPPSAAVTVRVHDEDWTDFSAWRSGHFTGPDLADDAISGLGADPDGTGLSNLARYAFGLPARGAVAVPPTVLSLVNTSGPTRAALTFPRKGFAPDLEYTVQASTDLLVWADLETVLPGYPKTVTITDPVATATGPRRFLRVRIDRVVPIDDAPGR